MKSLAFYIILTFCLVNKLQSQTLINFSGNLIDSTFKLHLTINGSKVHDSIRFDYGICIYELSLEKHSIKLKNGSSFSCWYGIVNNEVGADFIERIWKNIPNGKYKLYFENVNGYIDNQEVEECGFNIRDYYYGVIKKE